MRELDIRAASITAGLAVLVALSGCASATLGDKTTEADLKKLQAIPGKISLYMCRTSAFAGSGVGAEAFVNDRSIGSLKSNTFAHTELPAGRVSVYLKRGGIGFNSGDSGKLVVEASPGDVAIIWVGAAGGFGPVTVDNFDTRAEAESCVKGADYVIKPK